MRHADGHPHIRQRLLLPDSTIITVITRAAPVLFARRWIPLTGVAGIVALTGLPDPIQQGTTAYVRRERWERA